MTKENQGMILRAQREKLLTDGLGSIIDVSSH